MESQNQQHTFYIMNECIDDFCMPYTAFICILMICFREWERPIPWPKTNEFRHIHFLVPDKKMFEDTKRVMRVGISEDRQYNCQGKREQDKQ